MESSEEQLIIDNIKLIYKVINDLKVYYATEDEYQEHYDNGLLGLINGSKKYDGSAKPSTYLYTCIKNEIYKGIRRKNAKRRINDKGSDLSLNKVILNSNYKESELQDLIEDKNTNIEKEIEDKINLELIIKAIDKLKNKKDILAIKMYFELDGHTGGTYEEVARQMNVSRNWIYSRIHRAIPKIKKKLKEVK